MPLHTHTHRPTPTPAPTPTHTTTPTLQEAISSRKREQTAHREALGGIMAHGMHAGVHPLERPEVRRFAL